MTVLILDENLLWSARLRSGVTGLGHSGVVIDTAETELPQAEAAIVNLSSRVFDASAWIPKLQAAGMKVIAHAGHKEKPLLLVGKDSGADVVVTNGELASKLAEVLKRLG